MQNLRDQTENCEPSEADLLENLSAAEFAFFVCFVLPILIKVEQKLAEHPDELREAVRKEMQAARKQPEGGPLLSKEDVADWLQVSPRTVDTLAASGELKKIKVRGCVRFSPGAVKAYLRRAAGEGAA